MSYKDINKNTREYSHKLRKDYDKFNRIDFTQTLLFLSAKELTVNGSGLKLSTSFDLNDQVS